MQPCVQQNNAHSTFILYFFSVAGFSRPATEKFPDSLPRRSDNLEKSIETRPSGWSGQTKSIGAADRSQQREQNPLEPLTAVNSANRIHWSRRP